MKYDVRLSIARMLLTVVIAATAPQLNAQANAGAAQSQLSRQEIEKIGRRIWQSECGGSVDGLTSWNSGEQFASLGIGHFIWYPAGQDGPFEESFPRLLTWLQQSGVQVPDWLQKANDCPWPNRASFQKDHDSSQQKQLRDLLSRTVAEQTMFIIARLNASSGKMESLAGADAARVRQNMQLLNQSAAGQYAMIDYVNFKGDGLDTRERYKGQGWGLLQVLQEMQATSAQDAPAAFATAAKAVLARRVKNSPPERKEQQWLAGWSNRCSGYAR